MMEAACDCEIATVIGTLPLRVTSVFDSTLLRVDDSVLCLLVVFTGENPPALDFLTNL